MADMIAVVEWNSEQKRKLLEARDRENELWGEAERSVNAAGVPAKKKTVPRTIVVAAPGVRFSIIVKSGNSGYPHYRPSGKFWVRVSGSWRRGGSKVRLFYDREGKGVDWEAFTAWVLTRFGEESAYALRELAADDVTAINAATMTEAEAGIGAMRPAWVSPSAGGVHLSNYTLPAEHYPAFLEFLLQAGIAVRTVNEAALPSIDEMRGILRKEGTNSAS